MDNPQRKIFRLKGYDYSQAGAYFVTICSKDRECLFGNVANNEMRLNIYGEIVLDEWKRLSMIRPEITLDEFIVMPNHLRGIIIFNENKSIDQWIVHVDRFPDRSVP